MPVGQSVNKNYPLPGCTIQDKRMSDIIAIKTAITSIDSDMAVVGTKHIAQNSKSTNYTCGLVDSGKHIFHPSSDTAARTFTIPSNASVAYDIGTALTFINANGAGDVTIAINTDTLRLIGDGTTGSRVLAANGLATALKVTDTEWVISGTGLS